MTAEKTFQQEQNITLFILTVAGGLSLLSIIDLYGFPFSKTCGFPYGLLSFLTIIIILATIYVASKYISKKAAIWTSLILSVFEFSVGGIWYIESSKGELNYPWPPAYFIAIIFYTTIFYFISRLINKYLHKKADTEKQDSKT